MHCLKQGVKERADSKELPSDLHICESTCVPIPHHMPPHLHIHICTPCPITCLHICTHTCVLLAPITHKQNKIKKKSILLTKWAGENTNKYTADNGKCLDVCILETQDHSFPEQLFLRAKMSPQNCTSSLPPLGVRNRALLSIHYFSSDISLSYDCHSRSVF